MKTTQTVPEFGHIQDGTTWLGGPTHELQRQHIPGYQGHVHSLFAENVHGKNFARVTSECLNSRTNVGINVPTVSFPLMAGGEIHHQLQGRVWKAQHKEDPIRNNCREPPEQSPQDRGGRQPEERGRVLVKFGVNSGSCPKLSTKSSPSTGFRWLATWAIGQSSATQSSNVSSLCYAVVPPEKPEKVEFNEVRVLD